MRSTSGRLRLEATLTDSTVTRVELFFDLVFVFALTQVTAVVAHNLTSHGALRGLLLLGLLWWSWVGYAWIGNVVRADEGAVRLILLTAMVPMFLLALAIPEAFTDNPGGLFGPIVVAVCYFLFRAIHLALYWVISRNDPALRRQLIKFVPSVLGSTGLLVLASQFTGPTQTALWALALGADYGGTLLGGASGWRIRSASHFAERHGLIVIVALGESIVAIGVGVAQNPTTWPIVVASTLGLATSSALWWAYFDTSALHAEQALAAEREEQRARLARDAYSFLHFPLVSGVVFLAVGMEKVLDYVGGVEEHSLSDPLSSWGLYALYGGVVLYMLGHVAFKLRTSHTLFLPRLFAAAGVALLIPAVASLPALAQLTVLATVVICLVAFETRHYAEHRESIRHGDGAHAVSDERT